jgi:lipopolysaccharide/colanic/teichoic acid biosynthesis glycosyltransferase/glycosyltransferase involved in cell wall biosynthesis
MSARPRVAHVTTIDLTLRTLLLAQLTRLRHEGFEVTAISAPGPWVEDLRRAGVRHIAWPHATRAWNLRADLLAFVELCAILRRERFDLVHLHNPKPGVMGRIAARAARVPCVINTVHGLYATPEDRAAKRLAVIAVEWLAARLSDLELYQSREDLRWMRRVGVARAGRSELLGNGADLSRFDPASISDEEVAAVRAALGLPPHCVVVGTIGRLVAEKGYGEFFAAARRLRHEAPTTRFVVVGDADPHKADALAAPDIAAASDAIVFAGWRDDVPAVLAAMDVFVLASWREGLPRSAIEAAAMGKPLVLTDVRGCREVARDGVEGLLVPVRDAAALARAIARLVDDRDLRARLGEAARRRALERFDEARVADTVAARSRELLGAKGLLRAAPARGVAGTSARGGPGDAANAYGALKRAIDLVGALFALGLLAPVAALVALAIRIAMGRPVLFRQERLGLHGRTFVLCKFRTMTEATDERGRVLPDEQRLTRLGALLRATSLDELPEMLNVLRGDMSLVGPRPLLPEYRGLYSPEQWRRHDVRPGIAGPVTAAGRNSLSWDEKFALDTWYVDNRSMHLDLELAARTLWRALRREGVSADGHVTMPRWQGTQR